MWVVTFRSLCGPIQKASSVCSTRMEAIYKISKLKKFRAVSIANLKHLTGTGSAHGIFYEWSVDLIPLA